MIDAIPGTVAALGDLAYPDGSAADFAGCYESTWGRHKARTRPALGNHEYNTPGAAGYFAYFGATAGDPAKGYYSYELGAWHVIVLNSNLGYIDEAAQEEWLRADLAAHPRTCTMAYFHHPRFSSGATHGNTPRLQTIWQTLYDANADLVLTGHDHIYERFAPQAGDGSLDNVRGIRQFVVGSGGGGSYSIGPAIANSETRTREHGILKLEMDAVSYRWEFLGIPGTTFKDSGSGRCH
jgi:3',5'-cyclic AMP phosphodiesterase CpdA